MRNSTTQRIVTLAGVWALLAAAAAAQQPQPPPELASAPDVIKSGKWKDVDLGALTPLEHCRALLMLNRVLDELAPIATSRADLMSTFIDQQKLGADFANSGAPTPPPKFTFNECVKIAVAMLRGPMSSSDCATAFSDLSASGLEAYRHLYEGTCERKWSEVTEAGRQVRCMAQFLKAANRLEDYKRWEPGEIEARQRQYDQEQAQRRAAKAAADTQRKKEQQEQREEAQAAQAQQANQQLQAQNQQLQQALATAQQQGTQAAATGGGDDDWGLNAYGVASNMRRAAWTRDAAYAGANRAATDTRIAGWHGAGGGRR
jgi:hypothetical protein